MQVAVIGTGFGEQHLAWLSECPDAEVGLLVFGRDRDRAERLAERFGIPRVSPDARDATDGPADLVAVTTPVHLHAEIAERALRRGKDVVCEKPLALTVDQSERIVALATGRGRRSMVMFQWRFHPALQELRAAVRAGDLGRVVQADLRFHHDFLAEPFTPFPWRHDPARAGGGVFADQGVHLFDLLAWLLGEDFAVAGAASAVLWGSRSSSIGDLPAHTEDVGSAVLQAPSGTLATVTASRIAAGHRALHVTLSGSAGTASVTISPDTTEASMQHPAGPTRHWWPGALRNPYLAFLAGEDVPDFRDGLAAGRLMAAALSGAAARTLK